MIVHLKPYAVMKSSGVSWLGEVPEHWEVRRLRNAAKLLLSSVDKEVREGERPVRLCNYVDVYKNDRIGPGMALMRASATESEVERFRLRQGDVLITKDSEAWNDIGVPALVEECDEDLVSGYHLALLRPLADVVDGGYLFRALQSTSVAYQFHVVAKGVTRYGLSGIAIKSVLLPVPPLAEQGLICRFLDDAERRIRRYIRAKQRLIKLLEEQKRVIIHRAVTRGLDPNVCLRPSGVEWLGDVPDHWEVRKLRTQFRRYGSGTTPPGDEYYGGGIPWVMTGDLRDGFLVTTKRTVTPAALRNLPALRLYPRGSLLVAMYGATIGKSAILTVNACTNQACCVLAEPVDSSNVAYLQAVINLARPHLIDQGYGGGQPNINSEIVRALRIPVPPRREQELIVEAIDQRGEDVAIDGYRREIALLREYRTRLIADVVTGKLDVREAAARLPDEVEDAEPLDESEELTDTDEEAADDLDTVPDEDAA